MFSNRVSCDFIFLRYLEKFVAALATRSSSL
jgi:hypothetical protein